MPIQEFFWRDVCANSKKRSNLHIKRFSDCMEQHTPQNEKYIALGDYYCLFGSIFRSTLHKRATHSLKFRSERPAEMCQLVWLSPGTICSRGFRAAVYHSHDRQDSFTGLKLREDSILNRHVENRSTAPTVCRSKRDSLRVHPECYSHDPIGLRDYPSYR